MVLACVGKGRKYNHHCRTCKGAVKPGCYDKCHVGCCEECGMVFQSYSKTGCNDHTFSNGYNLSVKKVKSGLPADHRTPLELELEAANRAERTRKAKAAEAKLAAEREKATEQSNKKQQKKAARRRRWGN
jgi:hypothetical protein